MRKRKQQTTAWADENIREGVKHCLHGDLSNTGQVHTTTNYTT